MNIANNSTCKYLPLTPGRLNYYLSQCKKTNKNNQVISNKNINHRCFNHQPLQNLSVVLDLKQNRSEDLGRYNQHQYYPQTKTPYQYNQLPKNLTLVYDSLDLLTDRTNINKYPLGNNQRQRKIDNQQSNIFTNKSQLCKNRSNTRNIYQFQQNSNMDKKNSRLTDVSLEKLNSPRNRLKNNMNNMNNMNKDMDYSSYQPANQQQNFKKVKCEVQPNRYYINQIQRQVFQRSFKQISNELARINYQIKYNYKKLQEFTTINPIPISHNPAEAIKRANLKYAADLTKNDIRLLRQRPKVQYHDKECNDTRQIMWQPLH